MQLYPCATAAFIAFHRIDAPRPQATDIEALIRSLSLSLSLSRSDIKSPFQYNKQSFQKWINWAD